MSNRLLGVVLCGGRSSRMGRDKATVHYQKTTFLQHAIGRLREVCGEVIVSGNVAAESDITTLPDPIEFQGPVVGIATALSWADRHDYDACLVIPVDTPYLTVADLTKLKDRWLSGRSLVLAVAEQIEPLIGIYPTTLADPIHRLAESDDRSLARWLVSQPYTPLPCSAAHTRNLNTPADLSES